MTEMVTQRSRVALEQRPQVLKQPARANYKMVETITGAAYLAFNVAPPFAEPIHVGRPSIFPESGRTLDQIGNSLGVIDMSPNTRLAPHDRSLRAMGIGEVFLDTASHIRVAGSGASTGIPNLLCLDAGGPA
jgi:hypothetical protein